MTIFGDKAFEEVIKVNEVLCVGPNPIWLAYLLEEKIRTQTPTEGGPCENTQK